MSSHNCNLTVTLANHIKCTQLNPPITEVVTINIATTTLTLPNWVFSKMDEFVTLDSVFAGHIFSHFEHWY